LSTESWMCEETDGLTDMVKPTYAIQLCCEWRNRWTDRHGETNICHTTMLWVKKQMDWQTWWNQHMPYNYVVSGIKRNWPFFLQIKGHKPWTEHIFKSKIKLGVPFMVPDLVYKWAELKLLKGGGGKKKSLQTQIKHNALRPNDRGIKMVTSVNENVILHFKKQLETQKQYLVLSYKHIFISI
jgi:hypothetical protein